MLYTYLTIHLDNVHPLLFMATGKKIHINQDNHIWQTLKKQEDVFVFPFQRRVKMQLG